MHFGETEDHELVQGELVPLSSGTPRHARIRSPLDWAVEDYFQRHRAGGVFSEIDCRVTPETVLRPDVAIFLRDYARDVDPNRMPAPHAPDIAVEILSPTERAIDVNRKSHEYLSAGTREIWILDGENREITIRTAEGIRLYRESDCLESPLLSGFSCAIAELFAATYPAA